MRVSENGSAWNRVIEQASERVISERLVTTASLLAFLRACVMSVQIAGSD